MGMDLRGRVVLVTGAGAGIGLETVRAAQARGASVALVDRVGDAAARAAQMIGADALALVADVTRRDELEAAVAAAVERFGGIDVVVANAGIAPGIATVAGSDDASLDRILAVNAGGVWNTAKAALPALRASSGRLVVVASVYAFLNGTFGGPYAASKAAVESFARTLRVELAGEGVGVTIAYFGFVDTALVSGTLRGDPLGARFEALFPSALSRRITPQHAAQALLRGVERGRAHVIEPPLWRALFHMRGVTGPLTDALLGRDKRVRAILAEARERENETPPPS